MSASWLLREEAAELERRIERLTEDIEDAEKRIVDLRRKRDEARFHIAEIRTAADFLDNSGFKVERDSAGMVTVSVNPPVPA